MTLGTQQDGFEETIESETYAFRRERFPWYYNNHKIVLMKNNFYSRADNKLRVDLHLKCLKKRCSSEKRIRETVDMVSEAKRDMILLAALYPFFESECGK